MAKMWNPKRVKKTPVDTQNVTEVTQEITTPKQVEVQPDKLQQILERLERVEKENEELKKGKENMFVKAKERYAWPRKYSYKMWANKPVLSYESFKKDLSKDFQYKNEKWVFVSNHYLRVTLADKSVVEVEVDEFGASFTRSDKLDCAVIERNGKKEYEFNTSDFWTFVVAENCIN